MGGVFFRANQKNVGLNIDVVIEGLNRDGRDGEQGSCRYVAINRSNGVNVAVRRYLSDCFKGNWLSALENI